MNLIEITGNTSYNFNEEDVHNLFYICRSIYDQSIYEGKSNSFGFVKSSVLKVVKTLTDVEWLDLEELEEKEKIEMYQKMMDKEFGIKAIAFIFSVSEESIKKILMKA